MRGHMISFLPLQGTLSFWGEGGPEAAELKGELSLSFSAERFCTGYNDGEHMHRCPILFPGKKQCAPCASRDISRMYTRLDYAGFEAAYEKFRGQQFSVYVTSFAHVLKCGVTRTARLHERVTEQGADFFAEIARTEDAESAYSIEYAAQQAFGLRNGVTSSQKMKLLKIGPQRERIEQCVSRIIESGLLSGVEGEMKVNALAHKVPAAFEEAREIEGAVTGNKGQLLFFRRDSSDFCINMAVKPGFSFSTP
ncbi:MAG: DUF2797 domain-containing protein [Candidatus Micrarchaeia archaeon]